MMNANKTSRPAVRINTHGRAEFVPFQYADGTVENRLMYPVLDDMGNIKGWHFPGPCSCDSEASRVTP